MALFAQGFGNGGLRPPINCIILITVNWARQLSPLLRWSSWLISAQVFAIFNFSVDFISPNCIMDWGPINSYRVNLGLPVMWLVISGLQVGMATAWYHLYPYHRSGARDLRIVQFLKPSFMVGRCVTSAMKKIPVFPSPMYMIGMIMLNLSLLWKDTKPCLLNFQAAKACKHLSSGVWRPAWIF